MKQDSIKKQLKALGVKSKLKEKDGKSFFRLREIRDLRLEKLLQKIAGEKFEKTEKGFFIPKNEVLISKILAALNPEKKTKKTNSEAELKRFSEKLKSKKYGERTQKNYRNHFRAFLRNNKQENILSFSVKDLNDYLAKRAKEKNRSMGDTNMHINALRFYYEDVLGKKFQSEKIQRPKRPGKKPAILNEKMLQEILQQTQNLKHKALLILAYKSGLKTKEIVTMSVTEKIFSKRKTERKIAKSEGAPTKIQQQIIDKYLQTYSPKKFFFESSVPGRALTLRAIQKTLRELKLKAGLVQKKNARREKQFVKKK